MGSAPGHCHSGSPQADLPPKLHATVRFSQYFNILRFTISRPFHQNSWFPNVRKLYFLTVYHKGKLTGRLFRIDSLIIRIVFANHRKLLDAANCLEINLTEKWLVKLETRCHFNVLALRLSLEVFVNQWAVIWSNKWKHIERRIFLKKLTNFGRVQVVYDTGERNAFPTLSWEQRREKGGKKSRNSIRKNGHVNDLQNH